MATTCSLSSKIPLAARKAIKESVTKTEVHVKAAADALGTTIQIVDNTADLFEKLGDKGAELGNGFHQYFEAFAKAAVELSHNQLQKDALRDRLGSVGGRVQITIVPSTDPDNYWDFKGDALHMEVKASYWGSWLSYYNAERLEAKLTADLGGVQLPLAVRRNIAEHEPLILAELQNLSNVYGSQITWDMDQIPQVYAWLVSHQKGDAHVGKQILDYVVQFHKAVAEFCKNPDNKEAVQDAWKTNRGGFLFADSAAPDVYWHWQDGDLRMQVKPSYWGSWLSYYNEQNLEKTL